MAKKIVVTVTVTVPKDVKLPKKSNLNEAAKSEAAYMAEALGCEGAKTKATVEIIEG